MMGPPRLVPPMPIPPCGQQPRQELFQCPPQPDLADQRRGEHDRQQPAGQQYRRNRTPPSVSRADGRGETSMAAEAGSCRLAEDGIHN